MNRFRVVIASAAVCLALASQAPRARAADAKSNAVTSGEFVIDPPTLINLGFEWMIQGDDNRNAGVAVSRDQILSEVYGINADIGTERVDLLVRRLRVKLGDYPDTGGHIIAHPGYGYLLERRG